MAWPAAEPDNLDAYFGTQLAWAQDPESGVAEWFSGNLGAGREQFLGWGPNSWDQETGRFASTGFDKQLAQSGPSWRYFHPSSNTSASANRFQEFSPEQQQQISDAMMTTMANIYKGKESEKKGGLLLGKMEARSLVMEQLVEARRNKREAEISATRGLY